MTDAVTPFLIQVADAELADLTDRLGRTRWPDAGTVTDSLRAVVLGPAPQDRRTDLSSAGEGLVELEDHHREVLLETVELLL